MDNVNEQQELLAFQTNLKRRLRYLGSFFSIGLIILGIYLLLSGMMALVTKQSTLTPQEKEASIFDTPSVSLPQDATGVDDLPGVTGDILDGISTEKVSAASVDANTKSKDTIARIAKTGHWHVTDYAKGDIVAGVYEVKQGDTLWEIAEAVYGNGNQWGKILEKNRSQIGKLASGEQALIIPGQKLILP